jgi:hypothetical protein
MTLDDLEQWIAARIHTGNPWIDEFAAVLHMARADSEPVQVEQPAVAESVAATSAATEPAQPAETLPPVTV